MTGAAVLGLLRPTVYVQLHPDRLSVRHAQSGRSVAGPPIAAVATDLAGGVLAVGEAALAPPPGRPARVVNPFKHPRTLLADFVVGQAVLKGFLDRLFAGRLFVPSPVMVLHPRVDPEGGFTQIELRALRELATGAGAAQVVLWKGRELSDAELASLRLPAGGELD